MPPSCMCSSRAIIDRRAPSFCPVRRRSSRSPSLLGGLPSRLVPRPMQPALAGPSYSPCLASNLTAPYPTEQTPGSGSSSDRSVIQPAIRSMNCSFHNYHGRQARHALPSQPSRTNEHMVSNRRCLLATRIVPREDRLAPTCHGLTLARCFGRSTHYLINLPT
ncbi:hypothetical protein LZ32DRAFT_51615 [Colletotrichum eremochloae]|nr:hypothetical protein LZ32DRAFT_51615 [Colletotrichum eremochloae]